MSSVSRGGSSYDNLVLEIKKIESSAITVQKTAMGKEFKVIKENTISPNQARTLTAILKFVAERIYSEIKSGFSEENKVKLDTLADLISDVKNISKKNLKAFEEEDSKNIEAASSFLHGAVKAFQQAQVNLLNSQKMGTQQPTQRISASEAELILKELTPAQRKRLANNLQNAIEDNKKLGQPFTEKFKKENPGGALENERVFCSNAIEQIFSETQATKPVVFFGNKEKMRKLQDFFIGQLGSSAGLGLSDAYNSENGKKIIEFIKGKF